MLINASVRSNISISRELAGMLADNIQHDKSKVIHRDLSNDVHFISEQSLSAVGKPMAERNAEDDAIARLADACIEELEAADYLIIGSPIYNFGPSASLKAWADLVARAKRTFTYSDSGPVGLLQNKKAFIIAVSGGTAVNSSMDFMTPWLKHFLAFIGITDVEVISADGIYGTDGEEKIGLAKEKIGSVMIESTS